MLLHQRILLNYIKLLDSIHIQDLIQRLELISMKQHKADHVGHSEAHQDLDLVARAIRYC